MYKQSDYQLKAIVMQAWPTALFVLGVVLAGDYLEHLKSKNQQAPKTHHAAVYEGVQRQNSASTNDLNNLQEKVLSLEQQNIALNQTLQNLQQQLIQFSDRVQQPSEQLPDDFAELESMALVYEQEQGGSDHAVEQEFNQLEEQFYQAATDERWSAVMRSDLTEIELRLDQLTQGGTAILNQDCRHEMCRIEFGHEGAVPQFLPAIIASEHHRQIRLLNTREGAQTRTIALYIR